MALVSEVAAAGGDAAERPELARKWINPIARLLCRAKEAEDAAAPVPAVARGAKRIEPPRRPTTDSKQTSDDFDDLDDGIPF